MGVRCSLLGHAYGEPETVEEREERGNEVVVTVREVETCSRCGAESVISENTEVRSIEPAADTEHEREPEPQSESVEDAVEESSGVDDEFEGVESAAEDDGVILEDDGESRDAGEWPDDGDGAEGGVDESEDATASDDASSGGEAAGVGADASAGDLADDADLDRNGEGSAADVEAWPDPGVEDEGYDAEPSSDDDVDVEFGGGLQPESASADAREDAEYVSASGTGITSTGPVERSDDVDTVLVCPECEFAEEAVSTSQRPGDICPECRRGYLTERER